MVIYVDVGGRGRVMRVVGDGGGRFRGVGIFLNFFLGFCRFFWCFVL